MDYQNSKAGIFLCRPNRFIAQVDVDGTIETCHVKNTGRCRELLLPGATVLLEECRGEKRKTKFDLIAVYKGQRLINMDSQIPNKVFAEWVGKGNLFSPNATLRPEVRFGNSRFDFFIEDGARKAFVEVKGVTLEEEGVALFPDAPTERGVKHLQELCRAAKDGFEAYAVFIIQMDGVRYFTPNAKMHKAFSDALHTAKKTGVQILALDCAVTEKGITAQNPVEVCLVEGEPL